MPLLAAVEISPNPADGRGFSTGDQYETTFFFDQHGIRHGSKPF